jgi:hypothetical protein
MIETIKAKAIAFKDAAIAFVKREPVIIMYAILAGINVAALFGFEVAPEHLVTADAVLVPVLAYFTRKQVTPLSELEPMTVQKFIDLYGEGDEEAAA